MKYKYLEADKYITYHEDDEILHEIKVKLPKPPPIEGIDGYGLPKKKQKFRVPEYPKRLKKLSRKASSIQDVWDELTKYSDIYEEEIQFIEREWDRIHNGYWVFINGKPTYIDGWHYKYLVYWQLDIGLPEYRSRDRKFFIFARYTYTTTEAYYTYRVIDRETEEPISHFSTENELRKYLRDKSPSNYRAQKGDFFVDLGRRVCYGFNYPKHRREGATYKADHILFAIVSSQYKAHGGIQSMDKESAKKAFTKAVVKPWKKLPFFFSPEFAGSTDPKSVLELDMPATRSSSGSNVNIDTGLESMIDFATTVSRQFYDGDKLKGLHNDECGKTKLENVNERWAVQKKCLAQGNGISIHGLAMNTSTVGEMSEQGGDAYFRLCENSHYDKRNITGQTQSGLFNLFIPAYDGLENFIDIFGESIIEDPTEKDIWRWENPVRDTDGNLIGAKRYLNDQLISILLRKDEDSIKEYEEEIRLHPTSYSQCFQTAGSGSGLNIKKLAQREQTLKFDRTMTKRGNFMWANNEKDTRVIWVDDPIDGRWNISLELPDNQSNIRVFETVSDPQKPGEFKDVWRPGIPWKFTAGADPFKFNKTEGKRISNGGGNVFFERDRSIDPDGKPISEWQTYRNVCTYSFRPSHKDLYSEDMLMMCIYYGAMMYPEINIPTVWDYFELRGYGGYLKYARTPDGKFRNTPGFNAKGAMQNKIMQLHQDYIENYLILERHIEIVREQMKIKGIEDITNYDLFTAVGASFLGSEIDYRNIYGDDMGDENKGPDISDFF